MIAALGVLALLASTADVRALASDGDVVWAGTTGGLVRVDGEGARVFTPREGLPDGTVRALLVQGDALWVGTDRGVVRCHSVPAFACDAPLARGHRVEALALHEGALLVGTTHGLLVQQADGALVQDPRVGRAASVVSFEGTLHVASPGTGLVRLGAGEAERLPGDRLMWDLAVHGTTLYAATSRGLEAYRDGRRRWDARTRASRDLAVRDLRVVSVVGADLAIGSWGGGSHRWNGEAFVRVGPGDARVQALHRGAAGWFVGTPAGLAGDAPVNLSALGAALPSNDLSALARTEEGLFIGTFD